MPACDEDLQYEYIEHIARAAASELDSLTGEDLNAACEAAEACPMIV